MNNNIEDIYIGANYNSNNKKGKNIVLFFIIFLLMILIAVIACYIYFFKSETVNAKQLFFNHLSNNNVQELVSENAYEDLSEKLLNTNYEANSTINFSTNIENEELEGLDISNFTFNLNSYSNKSTNKTYTELGVNYSGNKVLEAIKIITNEDSIGIAQDEIVNKYVGVHYDSLKDIFGIDLNQEKINNLFKTEKNDLTEEYKKQLISTNINKIAEMIPEEKFTVQENIAISQNDTNIPVTAYTLQLSQSELNNLLVELFKNIRNDEEFLNKIVYKEKEKPSINIAPNNITVTPVIEEEQEEQVGEQIDENNLEENNIEPEFQAEQSANFEPISGEVNEFNEPQFEEGENIEQYNEEAQEEFYEENQIQEKEEYTPELELTHTAGLDEIGEENNFNLEILNNFNEYSEIVKLLLGLKINKTLDETQELLDTFIEKIDSMPGNGLTITVYASKDKTEKVSIILPNENTVELEILKKSDSENKLKLTYLYKGNNSIFNIEKDEEQNSLNIDYNEVKSVENEVLENQTNGISLEISKVKTTTNTSIDLIVSFIEDEKINKKINIKSDITGDSASNSITNNFILTVSTKENESKLVLDTNFKFSRTGEDIPDLVEDNCLFMEILSEEDYDITVQAIKDKIDYVWDEKKQHFDFIDTNTKSSTKNNIDRVSTNITIESAREALQNKIFTMMNEAAENEQEFTLQNLENLQIEGYEVSSVVNENEAVIVVDVYTFNVNSEFNIIDA